MLKPYRMILEHSEIGFMDLYNVYNISIIQIQKTRDIALRV